MNFVGHVQKHVYCITKKAAAKNRNNNNSQVNHNTLNTTFGRRSRSPKVASRKSNNYVFAQLFNNYKQINKQKSAQQSAKKQTHRTAQPITKQ